MSKESGTNYYEVVSPSGNEKQRWQWNFGLKMNLKYWIKAIIEFIGVKMGMSVRLQEKFDINEYKPTTPISICFK